MTTKRRILVCSLLAGLVAACSGTRLAAQVFVSAHDGKQVRAGDAVPGPFPDEVVTLRLDRQGRPQVAGRVAAPATLNGPPVSVAVSADGRLALVAAAQRFGPDGKLQPHGLVSAIDVSRPARPRVLAAIELPAGTMGVSFVGRNRALVASAAAARVSLLAVERGGAMRVLAEVALEPGSEPRDVVVAPDRRSAYVVRFGDGRLTRLAIRGDSLTRDGDIPVGTNPDGAVIDRDGRFLYNSNFGGTPLSGSAGAVSAVDLRAGRMVAAVAVGPTPEHVALSRDGRHLAVVLGNGSAFTRTAPDFDRVLGRLAILRVAGARLEPVAEAPIGHNCQGAAFSDDGRTVLVQCAVEKSIAAFRFDGGRLTPVAGALTFDGRPGAIAAPGRR